MIRLSQKKVGPAFTRYEFCRVKFINMQNLFQSDKSVVRNGTGCKSMASDRPLAFIWERER
jgi:hypothetical protein